MCGAGESDAHFGAQCPFREVFEDSDGEIKRLEEEAAADPSAKIHLIRYLQVCGGSERGFSELILGIILV